MRKRIIALLLLAALLAALCGCTAERMQSVRELFGISEQAAEEDASAEDETAQPSAQTAPVSTDEDAQSTFGLGYQTQFGLHPYACTSLNNRAILSFLYESLFVVDGSFRAQPVLAESWSVSDDGMTTTITLRSGVKFHNGRTLRAQDAAYSLQSAAGSAYYGDRLRNVSSITATDTRTLVLTTLVSYECLPLLLDIPIIPENTADSAVPPGTGPYEYTSAARLSRFSDWWQGTALTDAPYITLHAAETSVDVRDQFEYANVNLVLTDPNSTAYASFHNDYELWTANTTVMQYIGYNITNKVFSNYGLRSSITYAIDRETIVTELAGGFALPATLPASPLAEQYDVRLANSFDYSQSDFEAHLESASVEDMDGDGVLDLYVASLGYAIPVEGTMIVCAGSYQRVQTAQRVVDALNSRGFKLTLQTLDEAEYRSALQNGNFDLYFGEVRLSANFDLTPFFSIYGSLNFGGLSDSTMLNLCELALTNNGNAYSLHKRVCERGYITPVLFKVDALYTTRGMVADPTQYLDWYIPPIASGEETEG